MTAQLSAVYDVTIVDQVRQLTGGGITDTPRLPEPRWEALVRRCAAVDSDVAKVVARVDRRESLLGLARRFRGEAARADQHPGLRDVIDKLIAGNGKSPTNDQIDAAVDAAAVWSHRTRRRAEVVQVAVDQLPSRLGIDASGWASAAGCPKRDDGVALVPVAPFSKWCRHAALAGDLDALVVMAQADGVAIDHGKYSGEVVPVTTNRPDINVVRVFTWLLPVADLGSSRARAQLLLRAPTWRDGIEKCRPVADVVARIASGSALSLSAIS